jgi:hypothetical protein
VSGACFALVIAVLVGGPVFAADAKPGGVPPGKALVYLLQGDTGKSKSLPVTANGRGIGNVAANTYLAMAASPGALLLGVSATASAATRLQVEAGRTYFVSVQVNAAGIPVFKVLPPSVGQKALANYRPAQSAAVETPRAAPAPPAPAPKRATPPEPSKPKPAPAPARTGRDATSILLFKTGMFDLSNDQQQWFGLTNDIDSGSSGVFAVEYDYVFPEGWVVGAELVTYKNSWTQSAGGSGSFSTRVFTVNGKKYFIASDLIRPFVGVGVGVATTSFSGDITGSTGGTAFQIMGGAEFRFDKVGVQVELKRVTAKTEDDNSIEVDSSGQGIFVGLSIHF